MLHILASPRKTTAFINFLLRTPLRGVFDCVYIKTSSQLRASSAIGSFYSSSLARTASIMNRGATLKPPNILILSEDIHRYEKVKSYLIQSGISQCYCIYRLAQEKLIARLWMENCFLLIILSGRVENFELIEEYLHAPGNVLSFSPINFPPNVLATVSDNGPMESSCHLYLIKNSGKLVIASFNLFDSTDKNQMAFVSVLQDHFNLKRADVKTITKWTPIFAHGVDEYRFFEFAKVLTNLSDTGRLRNLFIATDPSSREDSDERIPLLLSSGEGCSFDVDTFRYHLSSSTLARVILYADVLPTTMTILDPLIPHLPPDFSGIVIAAQQSSGVGRSGNAWLSPLGAAMFTLHFPTSLDSELGRRLSIVQHLVALAVVEAVIERSGYEDVGIRIKWPNDLLHGQTGAKLGGILVKSSIMGKSVRCAIGCGINLDNEEPTTCLNELAMVKGEMKPMVREEFIARVVSKFEAVVRDFSDLNARQTVFQRYYKHWVHTNQTVAVDKGDGSKRTKATIVGIDEYGFLEAIAESGETLMLQPDGNSFDLFRNLIVST